MKSHYGLIALLVLLFLGYRWFKRQRTTDQIEKPAVKAPPPADPGPAEQTPVAVVDTTTPDYTDTTDTTRDPSVKASSPVRIPDATPVDVEPTPATIEPFANGNDSGASYTAAYNGAGGDITQDSMSYNRIPQGTPTDLWLESVAPGLRASFLAADPESREYLILQAEIRNFSENKWSYGWQKYWSLPTDENGMAVLPANWQG